VDHEAASDVPSLPGITRDLNPKIAYAWKVIVHVDDEQILDAGPVHSPALNQAMKRRYRWLVDDGLLDRYTPYDSMQPFADFQAGRRPASPKRPRPSPIEYIISTGGLYFLSPIAGYAFVWTSSVINVVRQKWRLGGKGTVFKVVGNPRDPNVTEDQLAQAVELGVYLPELEFLLAKSASANLLAASEFYGALDNESGAST
jgi:hypothetical protein